MDGSSYAKAQRKKKIIKALIITGSVLLAIILLVVLVIALLPKGNGGRKNGKYDEQIPDIINGYASFDELYFAQQKSNGSVNEGDIVKFGAYEQDNNLKNGKEEIEWIVVDEEEKYFVLVSKYVLDCKPYNDTKKEVSWNNCSVRSWLNEDFSDISFGNMHKGKLAKYESDYVYILSAEQVKLYFDNDEKRICEATAYAKEKGASQYTESNNCFWWLKDNGRYRNPVNGEIAAYNDCAASVMSNGSISESGNSVNYGYYGVRPVIRIKK